MGDLQERRYIVKLIEEVMDKFSSRVGSFELKDIVQVIIENKDNSFDLGFFFLHDQVKNSFTLGGLFPKEYVEAAGEIEEKLQKIKCNLEVDSSLQPGCGLFLYVARNFKKDYEKERIYVAVNDVERFKKKDDLARFDINIDALQKKIRSEYIFPVYIDNKQYSKYHPKKILHAVIVFASFTRKSQILEHDLKILSDIISFIISVEARKIANKGFHNFINTLSDVGKISYSRTEYEKIIKSLRRLYVDNEENSTLKQCLLKHASLWTINDTDPRNIFLVKEKNFNFRASFLYITNIITNRKVGSSGNCHYFYEFITGKMKKIKNAQGDIPFQELIEIKKFSDIGNLYYNKDQFQKLSGIKDDDIVVLFPIIPHIEKDQSKPGNMDNTIGPWGIGLITLYFDRNTCSYYYNRDFLELMSYKIYENLQIVIQKTRREIRESIFKGISKILENERFFYEKAASVIKEKLDFEHCLIYLFTENNTKLELKTREKTNLFPSIFDINGPESVKIISGVLGDDQAAIKTLDYIKRLKDNPNTTEYRMWYSPDFAALEGKIEDSRLYSAMLIPIQAVNNPVTGILICLNNRRYINTMPEEEKSFFSSKDYEIASIGAEVIGIYVEIINHAGLYKKLLRRLSHEIPTQSNFIMQNVDQIREEFIKILDTIQKKVDSTGNPIHVDDYERVLILNLLKHQGQAAYRVQLYAEYTQWEKLKEIDIKRERENLDMKTFLNSIIEGLRLNAEEQGIFVEFDFIYRLPHKKNHVIEVHPFFRLAVWNLINNAIQYSYFGINIIITFEDALEYSYIHVENIGVPIPVENKEKVYDENYRSPEAKGKYFKGTGFGLTLAKNVVDAHQGKILIENKNHICDRNIFGIFEVKRILESLPSDKDREKYINQKYPEKMNYQDFKELLVFNNKENEIFQQYNKFSVSHSKRAAADLIKNYLASLIEGNENLDIIFTRKINIPISYVKFSIQLPKQIK
jgi:signal transduction histidine kinase